MKAIKTSQGKPINAYAPSRHKPNVIMVATTNFSIDIARLTIKRLILRASLEDCRITFEKIWLRRCCSGSRQIISDRKFSGPQNSSKRECSKISFRSEINSTPLKTDQWQSPIGPFGIGFQISIATGFGPCQPQSMGIQLVGIPRNHQAHLRSGRPRKWVVHRSAHRGRTVRGLSGALRAGGTTAHHRPRRSGKTVLTGVQPDPFVAWQYAFGVFV